MSVKRNNKINQKDVIDLNVGIKDILDTLSDIVYVFDIRGKMLIWNEAFKKISGYTDKEISKMRTYQFFSKRDFPKVATKIGSAFKTGKASVEVDFITKNKKKITMFFSGQIFRDKDGKILLCGSGNKTTAKRVQQALRDREIQIRKTLNKIVPLLEHVAAGDLSQKLEVPKEEGKLKDLIEAVNSMIMDLRKFKKGYEEKEKILRKANKACEYQVIQRTQELKEERDFSKNIVDTAQAIILALDNNGKIIFYNKFMENLSGYKLSSKKGKSWFSSFLPKEEQAKVKKVFKHTKSGKQSKAVVNPIITKNKEKRQIEWYNNYTKDSQGKINGVLSVGYDITKRLEAEEKITASEKRFKTLFESSRDAIMTLAPPNWKFTSGNPATIEMFDCRDEKHFTSLGPGNLSPKRQPDGSLSAPEAKKAIAKAIKTGSHFFEWTHMRVNGESFPATVLLTRMELEKGRPFLQATVRDVTAKKEFEDKIKESEKRFRTIFDSVTVGIIAADLKTKKFLFSNPAMTKIIGYNKKELLKMSVPDLHPKKDIPLVLDTFEKQVRGEIRDSESALPVLHKSGKIIYCYISSSTEMIANKQVLLGIFSDVTEKRETERKLKEKFDELEKLNKFMVGRELRMIELKDEIKQLKSK